MADEPLASLPCVVDVSLLNGSMFQVEASIGTTAYELKQRIHYERDLRGSLCIGTSALDDEEVVCSGPSVSVQMLVEDVPEEVTAFIAASPHTELALVAAYGLSGRLATVLGRGGPIDGEVKIDSGGVLPGGDPEVRGWVPKTPLQYAAICHQPRAVKALVDARADVNARCSGASNGCHRGHQAIHFCCEGRRSTCEEARLETLVALLHAGAEVNAKSQYLGGDFLPLHCAAASGCVAMARLLLDGKATVDPIRVNSGSGNESPLYLAVNQVCRPPFGSRNLSCAKLLLDRGANVAGGFGPHRDCISAVRDVMSGKDSGNTQAWDKGRPHDSKYPPPPEEIVRIKGELRELEVRLS